MGEIIPFISHKKRKKVETVRVRIVPCEIYSRVVGYFRPVQLWNTGKQQEFRERKTIDLNTAFNKF